MKTLGQAISNLPQEKQSTEVSSQSVLTLANCSDAKKSLGAALEMIFHSSNVYGKKSDSLENMVKLFSFALADFTKEQIGSAFQFWVKNNSTMPTPADIVQVIKRGNKPPLSEAMYRELCKKSGYDRTSSDWAYIREFEEWQKNG